MREGYEERAHPAGMGGVQRHYFFLNGYGASVVRTSFSYGGREGLWELAVLKGTEESSAITYDTPITTDVIGWLSEVKVDNLLYEIEALEGVE